MIENSGKHLSIYLHIPFCIKKCNYCDFLSFSSKEENRDVYVEYLLSEIKQEAPRFQGYLVQSVFFGGGTPSILKVSQLVRIMATIRAEFALADDAEVSIEVNPGTASKEALISYFKAGMNRLSIGLQSAIDSELIELGRIHRFEEFLDTYRWAHEAGFLNINVDIMSALPGQTVESYEETLNRVFSLEPAPKHISAYSLIVEEGTSFYEKQEEGKLSLPTEETDRKMYELTGQKLAQHGYKRYEISNYAMVGFECRHNSVYWTRGNYIGFGLGASSLVENVRMKNTDDMEAYQRGIEEKVPCRESQVLTQNEQMEEFMFLGLRLTKGVSQLEFERQFGTSIEAVYGEVIKKHVEAGLLVARENVFLTSKGLDVCNYVMSDFLL